jgi:hypothetical protein
LSECFEDEEKQEISHPPAPLSTPEVRCRGHLAFACSAIIQHLARPSVVIISGGIMGNSSLSSRKNIGSTPTAIFFHGLSYKYEPSLNLSQHYVMLMWWANCFPYSLSRRHHQ